MEKKEADTNLIENRNKSEVIVVDDLKMRFGTREPISFKVMKGEIVAITGENGVGKSTLLRYLAGLNQLDKEYKECIKIKESVGFVFQNPDNQFIFGNMLDDIYFGPENLGYNPKKIVSKVNLILSKIHMNFSSEISEKSIEELSGGEKQRVAVADIWAMYPKIMILDEISSMQESENWNELFLWAKKTKRTIIYTSHREKDLKYADRIINLEESEIKEQPLYRNEYIKEEKFVNKEKNKEENKEKFISKEKSKYGGITIETILSDKEVSLININSEKKSENNMIQVKNITFSYDKTKIIDNLSFEFLKGRLYLVSGETGSGKSTLGMLLNRLLEVDTGEVVVDGEGIGSIPKRDLNRLRQKVGYVMQYPEKQLFCESVIKDVMFGPQNMGLSQDESRLRAEKSLDFMDIDRKLWDTSVYKLSGGEKRRIAIAGVLAMSPDYLILDEPFAGIDIKGKNLIIDEIYRYICNDKCVILISHDTIID